MTHIAIMDKLNQNKSKLDFILGAISADENEPAGLYHVLADISDQIGECVKHMGGQAPVLKLAA